MNQNNPSAEFDPRTAMALADETAAKARQSLYPHTPALYFIWGTAWLIGYGALHGARYDWLPLTETAALLVHLSVLVAAAVFSAVLGIRSSIGLRGSTALQGAIYGWSWALGFVVVGLLSGIIATAIQQPDLRGLIINSMAILLVGVMYMLGGALWHDMAMVAMGIWFLVVDVVAMILGPDYYLLVFLTLGVLGFYAGTIIELGRVRRMRKQLA
ncbi:hypothetical protein [Arthrobacter sp. H14]|uniref:hypothetical protein n=1 Tax=Arthrobacter sp. H14 TaxID=1312959 RepID=UPI0004BC9859|nr:hypothetical protein [Arthrobacter sp. H14]